MTFTGHRRWWMAFGLISALLSGCSAGTGAIIDFASLQRPGSPNNFLVCPDGFCRAAVDMPSPAFAATLDVLLAATKRALGRQERTALELEDQGRRQLVYVQRSALMRFPDRVWIEIVPLPGNRSGLAVFSRSIYGYSDSGVNKGRVLAWLDAIGAELAAR